MTRLLPVLLLLVASPVLALSPAEQVDASPARAAAVPAEAHEPIDRTCLRQTGTRIRHRAGRCAAAMGRSWSREDLLSTGRSNVVDALRALDPSIR